MISRTNRAGSASSSLLPFEMTNPANDIVKQARQGSVAAIIQVLNEQLADDGVRTRAFFADGVLQLLCEAADASQLEQATMVPRVQSILESISPHNIRRVNVNSRIICEQQLLWLAEITRDPKTLLWSQEISLKQPSLVQKLTRVWRDRQEEDYQASNPLSKRTWLNAKERRQFWRGLAGGAGLTLLALAGWGLYQKFGGSSSQTPTVVNVPTPRSVVPTQATSSNSPGNLAPVPVSTDPFVTAVRLAEQASQAGAAAKTSAEWLDLAARWQKASDLMAQVPAQDPRYKTAQDRVAVYQKNSELALAAAKQK